MMTHWPAEERERQWAEVEKRKHERNETNILKEKQEAYDKRSWLGKILRKRPKKNH